MHHPIPLSNLPRILIVCLLLVFAYTAAAADSSATAVAFDKPIRLLIGSGQSNMGRPIGLAIRNEVQKFFPDEQILLAHVAEGGLPIFLWSKLPEHAALTRGNMQAGVMYDRLIAEVIKVLSGRQAKSLVFCWLQGEAERSYVQTTSEGDMRRRSPPSSPNSAVIWGVRTWRSSSPGSAMLGTFALPGWRFARPRSPLPPGFRAAVGLTPTTARLGTLLKKSPPAFPDQTQSTTTNKERNSSFVDSLPQSPQLGAGNPNQPTPTLPRPPTSSCPRLLPPPCQRLTAQSEVHLPQYGRGIRGTMN